MPVCDSMLRRVGTSPQADAHTGVVEKAVGVLFFVMLQASLSSIFSPNSAIIGYAIEGVLQICAYLSVEIAPAGVMLSAPSVKCQKSLECQA